jgi:hypothetical protein
MYVWTDLPSLRDYGDGLMSVIASSKEEAIRLAADQYIGNAPSNVERHVAFMLELRTHEPEVISTGAVYKFGGS